VIRLTTQETPENATHWSQSLMAEKAGISMSSVGRIWKSHGLKPHLINTFKVSNDKAFAEKLEAIVGLYLSPPENAIVSVVTKRARYKHWIEHSRACR